MNYNWIVDDKLKFVWADVAEKTSSSVSDKGPSLFARILNEKSAFSPALVVFEK